MSALHAAIRSSNHHLFRFALEDPLTDVNEADDTGTTPLMLAAYMGQSNNVNSLLTRGANPSLVDKNGETALHISTYNNHPEIVTILLRRFDMDRTVENKHGKTAHKMAQEMNNSEILELFNSVLPDPAPVPISLSVLLPAPVVSTMTDAEHCQALIDAIESEQKDRFRELSVNLTVAIVNGTDDEGWTPLMWACARGETDMVKTLLAVEGIEIMKASVARECAYSVAGNYSIKRLLRDVAEQRAFAPTKRGTLTVYQDTIEQELCYGISRGCHDDVAKILTIPGLNINAVDKTYRSMGNKATALSQAAYQGDADVVEKLLNYPGIKVNVRDRIGRTPLMGAMETLCRGGDYERVVKLLIAHPETNLAAEDDFGNSALDHAKKQNVPHLAKLVRNAKSSR